MFLAGTLITAQFLLGTSSTTYLGDSNNLKWTGTVGIYKNGEPVYSGHNLFTNLGKEWVKQSINGTGPGTNQNATWIALSTNGAPVLATDKVLTGEISTNGLTRAYGTYEEIGTGQFNITKTFTATGSFTSVNQSSLNWNASGASMIAALNFTSVNLENNDNLTIEWGITLS